MFTIIIPTYNAASTIDDAIQSILCQTFREFEIVVVDGLSTDNTISILDYYKSQDTRIIYTSQKDKGIYDAMNFGVSKSQGEFIYFMGSDDTLYDSNVLLNIHKVLKNKPLDVVYGSVFRTSYDAPYDGRFKLIDLYKKNICHQAIFVRKEVFDLIGGFNLKYKVLADWDHNMRWFLDKRINKKFENLIVANFSEGGYSFVNKDREFLKDRTYVFLKLMKNNFNPLKYLWLSKTIDTDFSLPKKIIKIIKKKSKFVFEI